MNPPPNVRPLLEQQISALDEKLSGGAPAAAAAAAQAGAVVRVYVSVAPSVPPAASQAAPLFVFVRDPAHPGPPLAVKRLESRFPQSVSLSASDAVVPGRAFAARPECAGRRAHRTLRQPRRAQAAIPTGKSPTRSGRRASRASSSTT